MLPFSLDFTIDFSVTSCYYSGMENKKWYQKTLGIIILLILFFPIGLFLMWKHARWNKIVKIIITGIFALFLLGSSSGSKTSSTQQTQASPTPSEAKKTPEPTKEVKPLSISDNVWIALDNSMKTRKNYSVEYNESSKTASITFTSLDFYDESSMVRGSFTTLVKFGMEAFKIDGVDSVQVVVRTEFTDQYGKKSVEDAVRIIMSKSEFNKFDWNNLEYQPVYNQIKNASEGFYIHPAVLLKLNPDKLYLAL